MFVLTSIEFICIRVVAMSVNILTKSISSFKGLIQPGYNINQKIQKLAIHLRETKIESSVFKTDTFAPNLISYFYFVTNTTSNIKIYRNTVIRGIIKKFEN